MTTFWAERAERYEHLEWAHRSGYLQAFVKAGGFGATDWVLDVGTGTGIVAHAIAPYVAQVIGVDTSHAMLRRAARGGSQWPYFEEGDVRHLRFPDNFFDKVAARMVFHHLIEGGDLAMSECYRVLKPGGTMVLSEGVPPDHSLAVWFTRMFALKEERLTFFGEDLVALMCKAGFRITRVGTHVSEKVSIGNWLRASGLPQERQDRIMQMHRDLGPAGKRHYNMQTVGNHVFCDFKFIILTGRK